MSQIPALPQPQRNAYRALGVWVLLLVDRHDSFLQQSLEARWRGAQGVVVCLCVQCAPWPAGPASLRAAEVSRACPPGPRVACARTHACSYEGMDLQ